MYRKNDKFAISGVAVLMQGDQGNSFVSSTAFELPPNRENCKTLCGDFNRLLLEYEQADLIPEGIISCSGCTGTVQLEYSSWDFLVEKQLKAQGEDPEGLLCLLQNFPFFSYIDSGDLSDVVKLFRRKKYEKGEVIVRRGDRGDHFYVLISGKVMIHNEASLPIASLSAGEVFGEISLLCEESACATVQAAEQTELLYIDNREFRKILNKYPFLRDYFARLLGKRLSLTNQYKANRIQGMIGKFGEISPEALFLTLNSGQKTGILTITGLPLGTARFSLRQGGIIRASYGGEKDKDAFYKVLKEKEGEYKFMPGLPPKDFDAAEIGFFMKLLMEGLQQADLESQQLH